ncbi:universal stress protein [Streptomyces sp. BE147]|uniref:universal stress protein n=1 Tax=Streptomyces sp. BE147 TaxID=3002524 RepID=UPI002E797B1A|nr:universal stress protein [Streptomyces sp. BE147]MEE1742097.1 universal stress protein [Streptomyces sp. BE147]
MDETVCRRVVVGVSSSQGSLTPLHRAAAEARRIEGELWAVLAWEPPGGELGHRSLPCPPRAAECRSSAGERLCLALDAAFGSGGPGVPLRRLVVRGSPGRVLVETGGREDDLLVVGTGSRRWAHRVLGPSVARYCLAHASCPVLAVPPSPLEKELGAVRRSIIWRLPLDTRELTGPVRPRSGKGEAS